MASSLDNASNPMAVKLRGTQIVLVSRHVFRSCLALLGGRVLMLPLSTQSLCRSCPFPPPFSAIVSGDWLDRFPQRSRGLLAGVVIANRPVSAAPSLSGSSIINQEGERVVGLFPDPLRSASIKIHSSWHLRLLGSLSYAPQPSSATLVKT